MKMSNIEKLSGLNSEQVKQSRLQNGSNTLEMKEERVLFNVIKEVVLEPMFLLLLTTCIIYFSVGQNKEGIIMLVSIFIVAGISLFQEYRSRNAILALKKLSASKAKVMRDGVLTELPIEETAPPNTLVAPPAKSAILDNEFKIPITFNAELCVTFTAVPSPTISEHGLFVPYCENMLLVQVSNVPFEKSL